ncbi:MAG TPA: hypothetical protein VHW00_24730 [Thermoanaerobaculia bacterium]|nr:hypothetical protein [Thermoanaerobaculia bacterium]
MNAKNVSLGPDDQLQEDIDRYANMSPHDVRAELDAAGIDAEETIRAITDMIEQWRRRGLHQAERVIAGAARLTFATHFDTTIHRFFNLLREVSTFAQQVPALA